MSVRMRLFGWSVATPVVGVLIGLFLASDPYAVMLVALLAFLVGAGTFFGGCEVLDKVLALRVGIQEARDNLAVVTGRRDRVSEDEIAKAKILLNGRIREHDELIQSFPTDLVVWAAGLPKLERVSPT